MKLFKKMRKGFTLIELVVVIAVIAILSAVSIVSYVAITNRAKQSNDQQKINQVNLSLAAAEVNGKPKTMYDAIKAVDEDGFGPERFKTESKDYTFAYKMSKNRFVILEKDKVVYPKDIQTGEKADLWVFSDKGGDLSDGYSHYLRGEITEAVTVNAGIDVGENENVPLIQYVHSGAEQTVVIRTNGGQLGVEAPNDHVKHFGSAQMVTLTSVSENSFYENGEADQINIKKGRLVLTNSKEASVGTVYLQATGDTYDNIIIATQDGAELPELIARDTVSLPSGSDTKKVVTIQSNVNAEGKNPSKTETINLYATVGTTGNDVYEATNGYNVSDLAKLVVEASSDDAKAQAQEQLSEEEYASATESKAAVLVDTQKKLTDALDAYAKYIIVTNSFETTKAFLIKSNAIIEGSKLSDGSYPTIVSKATVQSEKRGFRINSSNIEVTLRNLNVDVRTSVTSDGGYPRGLQVDSNKGGVKLNVENCYISATHYAFNVCNGSTVDAVFTNSHLVGYGALNLWNASYSVVVRNSILEGIQNGEEKFAVVILEGDSTYQTTLHSTAIAVKLSQTSIIATSNHANGTEAFVGFNAGATANKVELDKCSMVSRGVGKTPSFYDYGQGNKLIANSGTFEYSEWDEESGDYSIDPSAYNMSVEEGKNWAISCGYTNVFDEDGLVYFTVYIPAGNTISENFEIPEGYKAVVAQDKATFSIVSK